MIIKDNLFVINDVKGKILNYLSLTDDGADFITVGLSHDSILILKNKFRCNTFSWENDDSTFEMHGENELIHLIFIRLNKQNCHVYLNPEETKLMKNILFSSH